MKKHGITAILAVLLVFSYMFAQAAPLCVAADDADTGEAAEKSYSWPAGPDISADGAIVIEASTGSILYEKNIYETFYPASTTKILTTLVALENSELGEIITVSYAADNYVSKTSSRMGLVEGEQVTVEQALYGVMLESGNEATFAVGEHVGGSIAHFIKMMNYKAQQLGCVNSHFANSHGLHDDEHYTCCYDMALIAKAAYANPDFMRITGTATYAMPETNKNPAKILTNHHWFINKTVKYDYCIGGKTGATTQAGYALVTYARKDGMTIISVVMHDETWAKVYADSMTLLDYCFDNFTAYRMSDLNDQMSSFPSMFNKEIVRFGENRHDMLSSGEGGIVLLPGNIRTEETVRSVELNDDVVIGNGSNVIGAITYKLQDRIVGASDIVYYETEDGMTDAVFKNMWPNFLIPVDVAFSGVDMSTLELSRTGKPEAPQSIGDVIDLRKAAPWAIGLGGAAAVLLIGLLAVAISKRRSGR